MIFQFLLQQTAPDATVIPSSSNGWMWLVLLIFLIVVLVALIWGIQRMLRLFRTPEMEGLTKQKILELWTEIISTAEVSTMGGKMAIIEADKLLDNVLKSMFMPGETLGERLTAAAYKYPNIRKAWGPHRLRNQLVHDTSFNITPRQIKGALQEYEQALKTLNVM